MFTLVHSVTMTKLNKTSISVIGSILVVLLFTLLFPTKHIVLSADGYDSLYLKPETFELHWVHSIEKEEWFEVFEVDGSGLILSTSHFKTFGAGVPSNSDKTTYIEDGYVVYMIDDRYEDIYLNVSENVDTHIIQNNQEYILYEWFDSYVSVNISIEYVPLIFRL